MAATDARPVPLKNTAFRAYFPILDADGDLVTGAAGLDSEVSIDGGTFADVTAEATEIATSSGMYFLDLTAAEMNGDCIAIIVKTTTAGAKTTVLVFYPEETGDINVDVTAFGGTTGTFAAGRPEVNTSHAAGTAWGSGAITAVSIAAAALNGKGDWNIGKTGYALSAAGIQAIWDALTSALTTVGSIGKLLVDNINATISSRATQTSVDAVDDFVDTEVAAILVDTGTTLDDLVDDLEARLTQAIADKLSIHADVVQKIIVGTGSTTTALVLNSTTGVDGGAPSATNDFYKGRILIFRSGTLAKQATDITAYTGSTVTATVTALTGSAAAGDEAVML